MASCVNTGSESMKIRRGMARYSSRQNQPAARQVDVEVGVAAVLPQPVARPAVVSLVVVDEAPAIPQPVRREGVVDVPRAVGGILRDGVGVRVVDALAGVFQITDLVAEVAQPEQVHQRTPGNAAERIAPDDAGEEDSHERVRQVAAAPGARTPACRRPGPDRRASRRWPGAPTCGGRDRSMRAAPRAVPGP